MGAYSGVGAYLSKLGEGAYSGGGGGVIREWGLIRSFTVSSISTCPTKSSKYC